MDKTEVYGQILKLIDELGDDELNALLKYVQTMIEARAHMAEYDPAKDSIVTGEGLFEGPPDLSEQVRRYTEVMQSDKLPEDYSEENDPSIGFFSGPTDLSVRAKQILHDEITRKSGWTQKRA